MKIKVPEGMIKEAVKASRIAACPEDYMRLILEAALRWLAENPIVPNEVVTYDLATSGKKPFNMDSIAWYCSEWQRRMFLAPEPEVRHFVRNIIQRFQGCTLTPDEADAIMEEVAAVAHGWVRPTFNATKGEL